MTRQTSSISFSQIAAAITLVITLLSAAVGIATQWGALNHRVQVLEEFNEWSHGASWTQK
jgi:hypothetical protein